jgi:hypothetical protein
MNDPFEKINLAAFLFCRGSLPECLWMNVPEAFLWA